MLLFQPRDTGSVKFGTRSDKPILELKILSAILALSLVILMEVPVLTGTVGSISSAKPIFFDDFRGNDLGPGWIIETLGGNYSVGGSVLTLSTNGPAITAYRSFVPQTDNFTVSARVRSSMLAAFALRLQASAPPIFGSTIGAQIEVDSHVENKNFLAAWEPSGGGWTWLTFYSPTVTDSWFVLEMRVQRNPFTIVYSVYNDSTPMKIQASQDGPQDRSPSLLGTFTTTAMGFGYDSIRYVALEAWSAPLSYSIDWLRITTSGNQLLFDDFLHGHPRVQQPNAPSSWAGAGQWTLSNINGSTVWFPNNTIATFSNFQFPWPPAVSLVSKGSWTAHPRLVLLERLRAWNFTNINGGFAWQTALDWGSGSAVMGYGRDDAHSPNTGLMVGGECIETAPGSVLTTNNYVGQWLTANITLYAPTQTMYFSVYNANGGLIGQTSSPGYCGTTFGTLPVNVLYFTAFGQADVDWISLTS
jgi:hypothetical protein